MATKRTYILRTHGNYLAVDTQFGPSFVSCREDATEFSSVTEIIENLLLRYQTFNNMNFTKPTVIQIDREETVTETVV